MIVVSTIAIDVIDVQLASIFCYEATPLTGRFQVPSIWSYLRYTLSAALRQHRFGYYTPIATIGSWPNTNRTALGTERLQVDLVDVTQPMNPLPHGRKVPRQLTSGLSPFLGYLRRPATVLYTLLSASQRPPLTGYSEEARSEGRSQG